MIQWNADLARRLQCRDEEKKELGPFIARLMDLDRKARGEGFLSLESELASIEDPILQVGLRLVMEGISGEALEEILATYLLIEELRNVNCLAATAISLFALRCANSAWK
jgi:flagellar motor component MotA